MEGPMARKKKPKGKGKGGNRPKAWEKLGPQPGEPCPCGQPGCPTPTVVEIAINDAATKVAINAVDFLAKSELVNNPGLNNAALVEAGAMLIFAGTTANKRMYGPAHAVKAGGHMFASLSSNLAEHGIVLSVTLGAKS